MKLSWSVWGCGVCLAGQLSNLTKREKNLLWQFFMDGKQSGKKKIPDKIIMLLWSKRQPKDYVRLPFQNSSLYE